MNNITRFLLGGVVLLLPLHVDSQTYKYERWMMKDNSHEVGASYGENTTSLTSKMHDGLDVYPKTDNTGYLHTRSKKIVFLN